MSGRAVVEQLMGIARQATGIVDAPDWAPDDLNQDQSLRGYLAPGESTPATHAGRNRAGPVVAHHDTFALEWHTLDKRTAYALEAATDALDELRSALWSAYYEKRLDAIQELTRIIATDFGEMEWGGQKTFGFQLLVDVIHTEALYSLRETEVST